MLKYLDFIIHINKYLNLIVSDYGNLTFLFLFLIIFCETGLVIFPILPGDSLLFASGVLAAQGSLNVFYLLIILTFAAILGDSVNYWLGRKGGIKLFNKYIKKEHLEKTKQFYDKHGNKMIVLARFIPIIRTFAPFVAGISEMSYSKFSFYNILGGIMWVFIFVLGGYFFGNIPIIKNNLSITLLIIIIVSLIPGLIEYIRHKRNN